MLSQTIQDSLWHHLKAHWLAEAALASSLALSPSLSQVSPLPFRGTCVHQGQGG